MHVYIILEVYGPSGPQLLLGGPSGRLDFVLRALRALRPGDPRNDVVIGREDDRNVKKLSRNPKIVFRNT